MSVELTAAHRSVMRERVAQFEKWGEQNHDPFTWLAILGEEVGEVAEAALTARFSNGDDERMREELVQVAAVAVAFVECLDRGDWSWPFDPARGATGT